MLLNIIKQLNWVDIFVLIVLLRTAYISRKAGLPREFFKLLGTVLAIYLSLHFEHPDEITAPVIKVVSRLRGAGAILLSQSVFLKGVNDDYEVLKELFNRLVELGIRPYYLYRCDPVVGSEHFIVPFDKEIEIMTKLRKELSGIACPTYVIDTPNGSGKIPVPLNFWQFDKKSFTDYNDKEIKIID